MQFIHLFMLSYCITIQMHLYCTSMYISKQSYHHSIQSIAGSTRYIHFITKLGLYRQGL